MIEKTEFGFTGSITDLPPWARDNPELGLAGALLVTQDAQLLATVERQVTKGLTVEEIVKADDATLLRELIRLFDASGGNVKCDDNNGEKPKSMTIFTCATQHVTGPDFRTMLRKALIVEKIRDDLPWMPQHSKVIEWLREHRVPDWLR